MIPINEKNQSSPHIKLKIRWIPIFILLFLSLLGVWRVTSAQSSDAPSLEYLLVTPSLTPSPTATVFRTSRPTASQITAPSSTATATAINVSRPTATQTTGPSSPSGTIAKVTRDLVKLRAGPGSNFTVLRQLTIGEPLTLLGRLSDGGWLYVKTSGGQEGWITSISVSQTRISVVDYPIETPSPPPETMIKVSGNRVNLRTGPDYGFSKVRQLALDDVLILLGRLSDNTWLYVKTPDGQIGWVETGWVDLGKTDLDTDYFPVELSPPTETATPVVLQGIDGHWIDLDLSEQRLSAYEGTNRVATFLISSGVDLYPTEIGQYKIYAKRRFTVMRGDDYFLPDVPFVMFYSGDFSIHGTYWHHNFGTPMSHGCVNMDTRDAEWLYNWSDVGTLVNIHR